MSGGDGFNDYFKIAGIESIQTIHEDIQPMGVVVYEVNGYGIGDKLFMGISEGRIITRIKNFQRERIM